MRNRIGKLCWTEADTPIYSHLFWDVVAVCVRDVVALLMLVVTVADVVALLGVRGRALLLVNCLVRGVVRLLTLQDKSKIIRAKKMKEQKGRNADTISFTSDL